MADDSEAAAPDGDRDEEKKQTKLRISLSRHSSTPFQLASPNDLVPEVT